jgi:hypothetical protein
LGHPTDANGSGCWPSPAAADGFGGIGEFNHASLKRSADQWPTPTGMDSRASGGNPNTTGAHGTTLTDRAVRMWPTPQARDFKGEPGNDFNVSNLVRSVGRHHPTTPTDGESGSPKADLNPRFVAALMGVPWDWLTPSTSVATDSYRQWLHTHSCNLPPGQERD